MTNEELTVKLLDKIGWDYDKILNPGHYKNTKDLFAGDLILAIFNTSSTEEALNTLNTPYKTFITISERFLKPLFGKLNGGGETWRFRFLHELELKECQECGRMLSYTSYHKDASNSRGITYICKDCRVSINASNYKKESCKESHKRSYLKHRSDIKARNALYRSQRELRKPPWSNELELAVIYKNCPEGMQVDHIIPLKGDLVSGLHVPDNLQYLSAEDNIRKSNSFDIEKFNNNEIWYKLNSPALSIRDKLDPLRIKIKRFKLSLINCLNCGKEFKPAKFEQSYCSKSCAGKHLNPSKESIEGYTKEFIESLIWEMPFTKGSKVVNLSDNGLRKMAIRLQCTMPPSHFHVKTKEYKDRIKKELGIKEYWGNGEIG